MSLNNINPIFYQDPPHSSLPPTLLKLAPATLFRWSHMTKHCFQLIFQLAEIVHLHHFHLPFDELESFWDPTTKLKSKIYSLPT